MSQAVQCICGSRFAAQPHLAGKTVACPSCGSPLHIPAPPQASPHAAPRAAANPIAANRITVNCMCGARFAAETHLAGQRLACPSCGQPLTVPTGTSVGLDSGLDFSGLDAPVQDAWRTEPAPSDSRTGPRVDEGLTTPVKIAIGVGGGAVVLLLLGIIVSSVIMPAMNRNNVPATSTATAAGPETAEPSEPAAESTLANVGSFVSGMVTGKPKTYSTPQAVFDAYWRARDNQDVDLLFATIAPDLHALLVVEAIDSLLQMQLLDNKVTDGLEKYGVDFTRLDISTSAQEVHRLASTIKDPAGFVKAANERMTQSTKRLGKENEEAGRELLEEARRRHAAREAQMTPEERAQRDRARKDLAKTPSLTDLKIMGDRATGTSVRGGEDLKISTPIGFVKIEGAWYVSTIGM